MTTIEKGVGAPCLLSLAPCFGACDLRNNEFGMLGVDLILHFGHSEIPELMEEQGSLACPETLFIELSRKIPLDQLGKLAERAAALLGQEKATTVELVSSVQYVHILPELKKLLEPEFSVKIPEGDRRLRHPGQVLGCNFSAARTGEAGSRAEEDGCIVFIGDGRFHPLGLALSTGQRTLAINPLSLQTTEHDPEAFLRSRYAAISGTLHARRFGILVSTKPGQLRLRLALKMKAELEELGREAFLLFDNEIRPDALRYVKVDCYVSTLCPRFVLDDSQRFLEESGKPVLTPKDTALLLKYLGSGDAEELSRTFGNYQLDEICECED